MYNEYIEQMRLFANELREIESLLMGTETPIAFVGREMRDLANQMDFEAMKAERASKLDDSRKF